MATAAVDGACRRRAAESTSRSMSNCSVMTVVPSDAEIVISVMPAMRPKLRSNGVARPTPSSRGSSRAVRPLTLMVGKSTRGQRCHGQQDERLRRRR